MESGSHELGRVLPLEGSDDREAATAAAADWYGGRVVLRCRCCVDEMECERGRECPKNRLTQKMHRDKGAEVEVACFHLSACYETHFSIPLFIPSITAAGASFPSRECSQWEE